MLKKLMITTAVAGLMMGSAYAAEGTNPPSPAPAAKSAEPAPAAKSTEMSKPAPAAVNPASASAGSAKFVSSQKPDQFLASKFKGTDVVGTDDKKIGDVSDILFDKEGKIEAFVISVGGFLGVGSKDVALAPTAFEVVKGKEGSSDKLRLAMSKDQLTQAQNFEPYKAPQATTGAGARPGGMSGSPSRPAGAPTSPSK